MPMTPCPMRRAVAMRLVWTCRTALGSPVEPEVYIQSATSSDIVGAVNGLGSAFASSSSKKCASGNCERSRARADDDDRAQVRQPIAQLAHDRGERGGDD